MNQRRSEGIGTSGPTNLPGAAALVHNCLRILMIPDPTRPRRGAVRCYLAPALRIVFSGGRAMQGAAQCTAFNAACRVKKRMQRSERVAGGSPDEAVVYSLGTRQGDWLDGTSVEGNRCVDRYLVCYPLIPQRGVWNVSAEWLLVRAGLLAG